MANEKTPQEILNEPSKQGECKKAGYALIGVGELTETQLLPAFEHCKYSKPVALISDDKGKLKPLAAKYNIPESSIYSYDEFDAIANDPSIDAVYIVLPNSLHKEYTVKAALAGKHVLCEKPMASTVQEAQEMIDACKHANKKLMIAYRIQYEPHHLLMQNWVSNKIFGNVKIIESFNGQNIQDVKQWRFKKLLSGGGALMDLGIYSINTIRFLTGMEPEWVSANIQTNTADERFKEVEESVFFQMGFNDGTVAVCGTSLNVNDCQRYRCITETDAWFGMDPAFAYQDLKIEISTPGNEENFPVPIIEKTNQFANILDHMSSCILNDHEPKTPGEEGLKDLKIIEAIYQAAKEERVVRIQQDLSQQEVTGELIFSDEKVL
ncbi:Gfo/Idh/MocA family oxidoreductase [soil metagenome]